MKLKVNKYIKDKKESRERNKKGELQILETDPFRGRVDILQNRYHPLAEVADKCEHKLVLGCKLPIMKRNRPECEACL